MEETENEVIGAELSDGSRRRKSVTFVVIIQFELRALALLQLITSLYWLWQTR